MVLAARFAVVFSRHCGVFLHLFVPWHVSGIAFRREAEIDTPRTGGGTVPGTVPGVTSRKTLAEVGGWVFPAILRPICTATAGPFRKVTCGRTLAMTAEPTFQPICIAIHGQTRGAICRGTCRRTCAATSTASCEQGFSGRADRAGVASGPAGSVGHDTSAVALSDDIVAAV